MIKINLLPNEGGARRAGAKPKRKGSGALTPFVAVMVLLLAGAGFMGWRVYEKAAASKAELESHKQKLAKLEEELKRREREFRAQFAEAEETEQKYAVVRALNPTNRLFWSEKLNQIARAQTKAAVYLDEIRMDERVEEVETPESIERRRIFDEKVKAKKTLPGEQPPKVVKMPVIHQNLTLTGIAYGTNSPQRLQQIKLFMDALKNLEWERKSGEKTTFLAGMSPEFVQLPQRAVRVGNVDVLSFGFQINAVPQMSDPSPPPPAPPGESANGGTKP